MGVELKSHNAWLKLTAEALASPRNVNIWLLVAKAYSRAKMVIVIIMAIMIITSEPFNVTQKAGASINYIPMGTNGLRCCMIMRAA